MDKLPLVVSLTSPKKTQAVKPLNPTFLSHQVEYWNNNNPFRKKGMEFQFPLSFPETMGGRLTNQKGSVFVGNWICAYPYLLPNSRNVLQTNRII